MSTQTTSTDRIANVDATLSSVIGQLETEANLKKVRNGPSLMSARTADISIANP